MGDRLAW